MKNAKLWKTVSILLVVGWMVGIFVMSSFPAKTSDVQSGVIVEVVKNVFNVSNERPEVIDDLTTIVRKSAHSFEYFVLGILILNLIRQFWPGKWSKYWYLAIIFAMLYAITDELHQILVPGRSCELRDILIDTIAASVGVGMIMLIRRAGKHYLSKKESGR